MLGQVKDSHRLAAAAGMMGPRLEAALQSAYGAAKRVRSETPIGEMPISIAAAAVQLAKRRGATVVGTASGRKHTAIGAAGYDRLIDYTRKRNRKLIDAAFDATDFLRDIPAAARAEMAALPDATTCVANR